MPKKKSTPNAQHFEFSDGKSHKFWKITLDGSSHTVHFGRVGTDGQTRTKSFASAAGAQASYDKLIKQKTGKGYALAGGAAKTAKSASRAKAPAKVKNKPKKKKPSPSTASEPRPADVNSTRSAPKLYRVDADKFTGKQWTSELLTINCLDMDLDEWWKQFVQLRRAAGTTGKPLPMIVERHGREHDCLYTRPFGYGAGHPAHSLSFLTAFSLAAWQKVRPLLDGHVDTVPMTTTREAKPGEFAFGKLAAKQRSKYVLLMPKLLVPFRHGQELSWNVEKSKFEPDPRYQQDESLPKIPMIDPAEFGDAHLFLLQRMPVATETFVKAVRDSNITGLKFFPFEYLPTPRVRPPAPKQLLEPMPDFPAAMVAKGWSKQLAKQWEDMWDWTTRGLKNRKWPAKAVRKKPPVKKSAFDSFERKHDVKLPPRFRAVLEKFAASVEIDHGNVKSSDPRASHHQDIKDYVGSFIFHGKQTLWDFGELRGIELWQSWLVDVHGRDPGKVRTAPFLTVANGDQLTVNLDTEEIRYWSHDGDDSLNRRLGVDMIDFVTRWSWLGVPAVDFLPDTPFYDKKARCLHTKEVPRVKQWHRWLQGYEFE